MSIAGERKLSSSAPLGWLSQVVRVAALAVTLLCIVSVAWFDAGYRTPYLLDSMNLFPLSLLTGGLSLLFTSLWIFKLHWNAGKTDKATISRNPGVVLWSHLLPLGNLILPFLSALEAFRAVATLVAMSQQRTSKAKASPLLALWWFSRLAAMFILVACYVGLNSNMTANQERITFLATFSMFAVSHLFGLLMTAKAMAQEAVYLKAHHQGSLKPPPPPVLGA